MSTEKQMKISKRFGFNLRPFKKVTPKQQKSLQKVQKKQVFTKKSNFAGQLEIKQSVAFLYGGLRAHYLTTLFQKSSQRKGSVSQNMISFLEKRLDTVLVKNHFVESFAHARQLISHQKVKVNGVTHKVPSFQLEPGDVVSLETEAHHRARQTMRDFLNRQEEQGGLKQYYGRNMQEGTKPMIWYKNTYCEVNYKTLEIVLLFAPQNVHYPMKVHTEKFTKIFKR
jgi:small subunit ribosomal protein S4